MDKDKAKTSKTNSNDLSSEYEIPISDNFKLNAKKKLGSGAFGDIYYGNFDFLILGINLKLNEEVAIKLVSKEDKIRYRNQLKQNTPSCFTSQNYIWHFKEEV
jgi:hypothetical protein